MQERPSSQRVRSPGMLQIRSLAGAAGTFLMIMVMIASTALAEPLTSTSYIQIGGSFSSTTAAHLASDRPTPEFVGSGVTVGEGIPVRPSGASSSLETSFPGFWAIVAGGLASLDADLDGIQAFLDPDDDNDGLLDSVETATGIFVSSLDTGSLPNVADSDGDGVHDGVEVELGFDPNDENSTPELSQVPATTPIGWALLLVALLLIAVTRMNRPIALTGYGRAP